MLIHFTAQHQGMHLLRSNFFVKASIIKDFFQSWKSSLYLCWEIVNKKIYIKQILFKQSRNVIGISPCEKSARRCEIPVSNIFPRSKTVHCEAIKSVEKAVSRLAEFPFRGCWMFSVSWEWGVNVLLWTLTVVLRFILRLTKQTSAVQLQYRIYNSADNMALI